MTQLESKHVALIYKKLNEICCILLLHYVSLYVLNTSGWQTLKKKRLSSDIQRTVHRDIFF